VEESKVIVIFFGALQVCVPEILAKASEDFSLSKHFPISAQTCD